ncbi:MAG: 4-hydroxythreonine-4-phosphate dehydrogenase PdxA [Mucinivorans sp.]
MKNTIKIGITIGDADGIGGEIIEKVLADKRFTELYPLEIFRHNDDPSGVKALYAAADALRAKTIDALVTCPINKAHAAADGFAHIGHTEYFAKEFGVAGREPSMFMVSDELRVVLVTKHVQLEKVASLITTQRVLDTIRSVRRSLQVDFGIIDPRIAVLGLNPHAGENGLLGVEEQKFITPAINAALEEGIFAFGPFSADGFFGSGAYAKYDVTVAMYHDQGLIPFKTLAMDRGVNFTAGLPVVRTSPAHGTGADIVGRGIASDNSLRAAIYTATDIVRSRRAFAAMTANPLQKQNQEQAGDRHSDRPAREQNVDDMFADEMQREK